MRRCLQKDFGTAMHQKEVFDLWDGFLLLCPVTEGVKEKLKLFGHRGMMKTSTFDYRVSRCVNTTAKTCKTPQEIDYFLRDLEVDTWSM